MGQGTLYTIVEEVDLAEIYVIYVFPAWKMVTQSDNRTSA